jgi:hypothetical protein
MARNIMVNPDYLKRIVGNLMLFKLCLRVENQLFERTLTSRLMTLWQLLRTKEYTSTRILNLFFAYDDYQIYRQGFGLAVVKRMAEGLDGTVTFESTKAKGTTFIDVCPPKS